MTRWPRWNAGPPPCMMAATTASWWARYSGSASRGPTAPPCCTTPAITAASPANERRRVPHPAPAPRSGAPLLDGRLDLVQAPVQVRLADDQRRREPDGAPVGVLGEHAARGEPPARLPAAQRGEFDPGPQPAPAHLADDVPRQRGQPVVHARAELGRTLLEFAGREHGDDLPPDRAGERVAAKRRPVLAGLEHAEHLA